MVEILGSGTSGQAEKETQEKASSLTETLKLTTGTLRRQGHLHDCSQIHYISNSACCTKQELGWNPHCCFGISFVKHGSIKVVVYSGSGLCGCIAKAHFVVVDIPLKPTYLDVSFHASVC